MTYLPLASLCCCECEWSSPAGIGFVGRRSGKILRGCWPGWLDVVGQCGSRGMWVSRMRGARCVGYRFLFPEPVRLCVCPVERDQLGTDAALSQSPKGGPERQDILQHLTVAWARRGLSSVSQEAADLYCLMSILPGVRVLKSSSTEAVCGSISPTECASWGYARADSGH